ncbi:hypothetical protein [Candidatus Mycobacterium methanotrophicum]|uniref:Uncharacterized protein n=1 Tax=Candidatus Mycobacterium methanotrophicum TaxID=2943498 RepID=A0ABY4QLE7_9MYCO|nr:hypothetical protein [Candidatus Mycobacterium methanotrophicum]UQX10623.1 hypothetical protein M5I08_21780 [Candidatus Mycobacterium methanotrophicum]
MVDEALLLDALIDGGLDRLPVGRAAGFDGVRMRGQQVLHPLGKLRAVLGAGGDAVDGTGWIPWRHPKAGARLAH